MKEERDQFWNVFERTGSAMDYLQYACAGQKAAQGAERKETDSYERPDNRDGDGAAGVSGGRL